MCDWQINVSLCMIITQSYLPLVFVIFSLFIFFYSFRQNKDIALVNLANILHRAHFSADAAIVVHAALDYSDFFTSYYTLGNIYAVNTIFIFQDLKKIKYYLIF